MTDGTNAGAGGDTAGNGAGANQSGAGQTNNQSQNAAVVNTIAGGNLDAGSQGGRTQSNGADNAGGSQGRDNRAGTQSGSGTQSNQSQAADFPADWRERMADGDSGMLNQLKRYDSPKAVAQWLRTNQLRLSAGELRPVLKPDATPEEMATFRKENGLPENADTYIKEMKLPDGLNAGDGDQEILKMFAEAVAMPMGMTKEQFSQQVGWFLQTSAQIRAQELEMRNERDQEWHSDALIKTHEMWGPDFKANQNALKSFWSDQPPELANAILGARIHAPGQAYDGQILGNVPEISSWLANISRQLNPAATILPNAGLGDAPQALATRKSEIESMMYIQGKPNPKYWQGDEGKKIQSEYRDILDALERVEQRNKGSQTRAA